MAVELAVGDELALIGATGVEAGAAVLHAPNRIVRLRAAPAAANLRFILVLLLRMFVQ
jgi:hypothetical protein